MSKPRDYAIVNWHLRMPADVAREVDRLLLDPWTGRVGFGRRTDLIIRLLRQWLAQHRQIPGPLRGPEDGAPSTAETEDSLSDNSTKVSPDA